MKLTPQQLQSSILSFIILSNTFLLGVHPTYTRTSENELQIYHLARRSYTAGSGSGGQRGGRRGDRGGRRGGGNNNRGGSSSRGSGRETLPSPPWSPSNEAPIAAPRPPPTQPPRTLPAPRIHRPQPPPPPPPANPPVTYPFEVHQQYRPGLARAQTMPANLGGGGVGISGSSTGRTVPPQTNLQKGPAPVGKKKHPAEAFGDTRLRTELEGNNGFPGSRRNPVESDSRETYGSRRNPAEADSNPRYELPGDRPPSYPPPGPNKLQKKRPEDKDKRARRRRKRGLDSKT